MEEPKVDQVEGGIAKEEEQEENKEEKKGDEQLKDNQKEPNEEPATLETVVALVKGLQKGYTLNAQAIADIRGNLKPAVDEVNQQAGNRSGDEEFLTVGSLKQILNEQARNQSLVQQKSQEYIDTTLAQFRADGTVKNDDEEKQLIQYAVDKKEPDLLKAAERWNEVKKAKADAKKEAAKTTTQQEEGSKVGTSTKTSLKEQGGVDYNKVRNTDFSGF